MYLIYRLAEFGGRAYRFKI